MSSDTLKPGTQLSPLEYSFLAPKTLNVKINVHLTFLAASTMVFLTTTLPGHADTVKKPMGSFVCAVPDRFNPKTSSCTPLYTVPSTVDYATRVARILAQRMKVPVYVGCSMDLAGITSEEEMDGLIMVIDTILSRWHQYQEQTAKAT